MKTTYIDLHTHTLRSDGAYSPEQLCTMAMDAGIRILALTEHNHTEDLSKLRKQFPNLQLIQGAEIGCRYMTAQGREVEIHVVGLGIDPNHPQIKAVLAHNNPDRGPYINAILHRLRQCGIDVGNYEDMRRRYPNTRQIGRRNIATCMKELGYVSSVEEAYDLYIGAFGEKRAYVQNPAQYVSMEDAVSAIIASGGAAVLAHLYYYQIDDQEQIRLLKIFKKLAGNSGGMEVFYDRYTEQQRAELKRLADRFDLMYSAASDFHGQHKEDTLDNHFLSTDCLPLLRYLGLEPIA